MLIPKPFLVSLSIDPENIDSDMKLVGRWVETYDSPRSRESAKKEGVRFILWLASQNKNLQSFTMEDALPLKRFLNNPTPKRVWVGRKKGKSQETEWKPFAAGLSESSIRTSFAYLRSLYKFLVTIDSVSRNPFSDAKVKFRNVDCRSFQKRSFTPAARGHIVRFFSENPRSLDTIDLSRRKLLFFFAFHTGARRSEIASAMFSDIRVDKNGLYWWHVIGKGQKVSQVPVGEELLSLIFEHLSLLGPKAGTFSKTVLPKIPLISGLSASSSSMSPHRIWSLFKETAAMIANEITTCGDLDSAAELQQASTHWLRHSAGSFQLSELGLTLAEVRDNLRHASIATTSLYVDSEDRIRHDKVRDASL